MSEIREKQSSRKWGGKRVWRGNLLYEILRDDPEKNSMTVMDIAHQEKEEWDRGQFLSIALRMEERELGESLGGPSRMVSGLEIPKETRHEVRFETQEEAESGVRDVVSRGVRDFAERILGGFRVRK